MSTFNEQRSCLDKRRAKKLPKTPANLIDLEFETEYKTTADKKLFLQYDNKSLTNRIIIFYSEVSEDASCESTEWYSDGTFKSCPLKFLQLYTIHGIINEQSFVGAAILTQKKDYNTYKEVFGVIKERTQSLGKLWAQGFSSCH